MEEILKETNKNSRDFIGLKSGAQWGAYNHLIPPITILYIPIYLSLYIVYIAYTLQNHFILSSI